MSRRTLFSIWLQGQREKLGLSLDSLSERLDCTADELRTIEAGRAMPGKEMAGRLADFFEVREEERPVFILFASSDLDADTDFEASDLAGDETPWRHRETPPNNLPAQVTSFIGREGEVDKVAALLRRPQTRLLTMTGPPGIGKTRLSQEVGARFLEESLFEDGIFFVPLAPITEPELVAGAIGQTLNVKETSGQSPLESLKEFMRDRRMLLVLDNFEQIVPAGSVVGELLGACEGLKALVTSREALHIYGEQVFFVPPMELPRKDSVPTAETLEQWEAADLFMQRARAARPDFAVDDEGARTIGEICRRLDGLPLAIELAAARASILSPLGILSRLDNRLKLLTGGSRNLPPRQQTLRSAIDWSYDLLDEDEGRLFRYLSVFVGGCTLEAAESVVSNSHEGARPAMDLVSSLLDKSLLKQEEGVDGEPRFMMLETIREYGLERLAESGEETAVRRAHALYMVQLVEAAEPHLTSAARAPWLARLDAELDNIRSGLAWSQTAEGDAELGLRLAGALHWYWYWRGYIIEGRKWLGQALGHSGNYNLSVRARVLFAAGRLAHVAGEDDASPLLEECITLSQLEGDEVTLAYAGVILGLIAVMNDTAKDTELCRRSVDRFRHIGHNWGLAYALADYADAEYYLGNSDAGDRLYFESLQICRELNDGWGIAAALAEMGRDRLRRGDFDKARSLLEEALGLERLEKDRRSIAHSSRSLGIVAQHQGDYARALRLYEESLLLYKEVGARQHTAAALRSLADLMQYQGDYSAAIAFYQESVRVPVTDSRVAGLCCAGLARIASIYSEWESAAQFFSAANSLGGDVFAVLAQILAYLEYEQYLSTVRAKLSQDAFAEAWAAGSDMSPADIDLLAEQLRIRVQLKESILDQQPQSAATVAQKSPGTVNYPGGLSRREAELLQLVALGLRNAEIASRLFLSPNTVRAHLYSIYAKINVTSRTAAARFAMENNLV
jgi:predicted ATPase/DNA-binding CsgD family transcriptional regulator/transcriptional regulator with XRE-family HTH domain